MHSQSLTFITKNLLATALFAALLLATCTSACSCVAIYFPTMANRIKYAKEHDTAILVAEVTKIAPAPNDNYANMYTFHVSEVFMTPTTNGDHPVIISNMDVEVKSMNESSLCGMDFKMGEKWLLGLWGNSATLNAASCDKLSCRLSPQENYNGYHNCTSRLDYLRSDVIGTPTPGTHTTPTPTQRSGSRGISFSLGDLVSLVVLACAALTVF